MDIMEITQRKKIRMVIEDLYLRLPTKQKLKLKNKFNIENITDILEECKLL